MGEYTSYSRLLALDVALFQFTFCHKSLLNMLVECTVAAKSYIPIVEYYEVGLNEEILLLVFLRDFKLFLCSVYVPEVL